MTDKDFWKLDRTFNIVLIVITLVIAPAAGFYVFREPPHPTTRFVIPFVFAPLMLLVLLWWVATFFDNLALRIVCWYGLLYFVCHSFWLLTETTVLSLYESLEEIIGFAFGAAWFTTSYLLPIIPIWFIFKKYADVQKPSREKVLYGIIIFSIITLCLSVIGVLLI